MPGGAAIKFADILQCEGVASTLIKFLHLQDKRNLRLVCHAGKSAVDKTVTYVYVSKHYPDNVTVLCNSKWKEVKRVEYSMNYDGSEEFMGLAEIVTFTEAGFSRLESLAMTLAQHIDASSAQQMIKAGWKLKELVVGGPGFTAQWLATVMREAQWPLESLIISKRTDDNVADVISASEWKLKKLSICNYLGEKISPEGVQVLMQGSWVSTIETLCLTDINLGVKGAKAIADASHRALKLYDLALCRCLMTNEEALMLGEGSYQNLEKLDLESNDMEVSTLAAIFRKCPVLKGFEIGGPNLDGELADARDAKTIAEKLENKTEIYLDRLTLPMSRVGARELFTCIKWAKLESLIIGDYDNKEDWGDEAIAGLVMHEWPCLNNLRVENAGVTAVGSRLFSGKLWPALKSLWLEVVEDSGLELDPMNLPKLEDLTMNGTISQAVSHFALQYWPRLKNLGLFLTMDGNEVNEPDIATKTLKLLKGIKATCVPHLATLCFRRSDFTEREGSMVQLMADFMGYEVYWYGGLAA